MAAVRLSATDAGTPVAVHVGDTASLLLPETPTTGFTWRWRVPAELRVVADEPVGLSPGAPGMETQRRLAVEVTTAGRYELVAELARPWEPGVRSRLAFVLVAGPAESAVGR
jgi:predicted secreted protein